MNNSVKLLTILLAMIVTSGQAWAQDPSNKPPYFIDKDNIKLAVPEEKTKAKAGCVEAGDEENDGYTFEITGGTAQDLFDIGLTTGVVTMKNGVEPFDYEAWKELYTKYVIVVDLCDTRATTFNTNLCSQAKFEVSVTDVNEKPYFTNQSDVISIAEGAAVSTDAITYADPDKYTDEFLNNELVIIGGDSELFELTSDGNIKPKEGAVIDKGEHKIEVRVRDANKDGDENYVYPDLYNDMTFKIRYYVTGVDYLDWDDTERMFVKKNTATDDNDANDKVYVLQGTETTLGQVGNETWYVCNTPATDTYPDGLVYQDQVDFSGNVHLILVDGCKMTVDNAFGSPSSYAIGPLNADLTIYGQTDGSGTLAAYSLNQGIYSQGGSLTINGGTVYARGEESGIYLNSSTLTINGGQVTAIGSNSNGIYANSNGGTATVSINGGKVNAEGKDFGIETYDDITISGGKVTATGRTGYTAGIASRNGNIHLGWTNADDYIYATGYINGGDNKVYVDATAGQRFVAWTPAATEGGAETASSIVGSGLVSVRSTVNGKVLRPLAVAETGTDGKVTTSPGYVVTTPAGLTLSGKTDDSGAPKPDFTISTGTGGTAVTTPYYIYKEGADVSIATNDYLHDGVEISGTNVPATVAVSQDHTQATFAMPDEDVTLTGMKFYAEAVDYRDWDESTKTLVAKNTSELSPAPRVYILTGDAAGTEGSGATTTLPGGWYVVTNWNTAADGDGHSPDAAYTSLLQFNGATHLILADGAEMSVDILDSDTQGFGYAIFVKNSDLATLDIYGQALGTGALTAKSARFDAIYLRSTNSGSKSNLTINGGKVSATCSTSYDGIFVCGGVNSTASVIINGGEVTASGKYAINAYSGNASVTITGGQVEASGNNGIKTNGDITLNLTNGSDFIKASSYEADGSVMIPAGKALACTIGEYTTVMGSTDADYIFDAPGNTTIEYINGQTLVVAKPLPDAAGKSYIAYCSDNGNWILNNTNAKVYVVIGYNLATGQVILKEVTGNLTDEIPNGVPVIIGGASLSDLWLVGEEKLSDAAAGSISGGTLANFFVCDGTKDVGALLTAALGPTADLSDYVLFMLSGDGIFKPVSATATSTPAKGACVLAVSKVDILTKGSLSVGGTSNARSIAIALGGETTGIEEMAQGDMQNAPSDGSWYDLQGRKLSGRPIQKGIYIRNGRAVIIP